MPEPTLVPMRGDADAGVSRDPFGLWGRAFRPFFLALAVYAALAVPFWTLAWLGAVAAPTWLAPMHWHGHEMLFGFVAAAIAGFLLTAAPVWTGRAALTGAPLAAIVALWIAGRIAFALARTLPMSLVAITDVAFLPAVGAVLARTLGGAGWTRNHGVLGIVGALALANAAMHAEALGLATGTAAPALRFGVDLVVVLLLVIAGRITPAFTQNALQRRGGDVAVRTRPWIGGVAIGAAAALALATPAMGRGAATGVLALVAGLAAALRMAGWRTRRVLDDPLLGSLHAGSMWVAVGLLLVAAGDLGASVPTSAGLHALTAGAMGTTILAVVTRVGLGHTGRALVLPRGVQACYVLAHAGAIARVLAAFASGEAFRALLLASGLAWALAFALFAVRYAPILLGPRADGRPG